MEHKKEKKIDTDAYTINKAIVVLKVATKLINYSCKFLFIFIKFVNIPNNIKSIFY